MANGTYLAVSSAGTETEARVRAHPGVSSMRRRADGSEIKRPTANKTSASISLFERLRVAIALALIHAPLVLTPFPDVSMEVEKAQIVWLEAAHRLRVHGRIPGIPTVFCQQSPGLAERIRRDRQRIARVLPLRFGWQAVARSFLSVRPRLHALGERSLVVPRVAPLVLCKSILLTQPIAVRGTPTKILLPLGELDQRDKESRSVRENYALSEKNFSYCSMVTSLVAMAKLWSIRSRRCLSASPISKSSRLVFFPSIELNRTPDDDHRLTLAIDVPFTAVLL